MYLNNTAQIDGPSAARNAEKSQASSPKKHYDLNNHRVVATVLQPGQKLFLAYPRVPEGRLLVQGQHFDFTPPYKGRPEGMSQYSRDTSHCALFTALVPLLVALHDPWDAGLKGARTLGHIRQARHNQSAGFGLAKDMYADNPDILKLTPRWAHGCRESHYPEHLVLGGPLGAVIYEDEVLVPAYRYEPGVKDHLPFCFIVEGKDEELILKAFMQGAKAHHALKDGAPKVKAPIDVAVSGVMQTRQLNNVTVQFDRVGRVHGITQHNPQTGEVVGKQFLQFKNKTHLRVGEIVTNPALREALDMAPLPGSHAQVEPERPTARPRGPIENRIPLDNIRLKERPPTPEVIHLTCSEMQDPPIVIPPPEPAVTPEPEPEVVQAPEPEVKVEPEPAVTPEPEPEVVQAPEPEVKVEPEPAVTPEPEPEVVQAPEPEVKVEPETIESPTAEEASMLSMEEELNDDELYQPPPVYAWLAEEFEDRPAPQLLGKDGYRITKAGQVLKEPDVALLVTYMTADNVDLEKSFAACPKKSKWYTEFYQAYMIFTDQEIPEEDKYTIARAAAI